MLPDGLQDALNDRHLLLVCKAAAGEKDMIDHPFSPRGGGDFADQLRILLFQDGAICPGRGNEIAEQALPPLREVAAMVLVAEKQTVLSPDLPDLDHFLVLGKHTIVKGGPQDPLHLADVLFTMEQPQNPAIGAHAERR
jgi:hypothetical protein